MRKLHPYTAIAQRKNIIDSNFLYIRDAEQRFDDLQRLFTTISQTDAILNTAIAEENPSEIRIRFEDYRWQISDRFYRVDEALKDLCCTDLPKVGESLSPVIKMMEVSP